MGEQQTEQQPTAGGRWYRDPETGELSQRPPKTQPPAEPDAGEQQIED